jgi:hypothetical protein
MLEFQLQNCDERQMGCVVEVEKKKSKKELLIEKKQEIEEELKKIEAQENAAAEKLNIQRKFIVGEVALAYVSKNPEFAKLLQEALKELVTKSRDLEVIADLINVPSEQPDIEKSTDLTSDSSTTEQTTVDDNPA